MIPATTPELKERVSNAQILGQARLYLRGAGAGGVEDLDSNQGGLLGNTIEATANGTSDVGAVAVSVGVGAVDVVAAPDGTTLEVLMKSVSLVALQLSAKNRAAKEKIHTEWAV